MVTIKTLDAHTAGEPLRLIIDGFPEPQGDTMLERREWLREHHDDLRRAIMLEPRGHADMYGALLTRPERAGSDAGVLFMHNEGYSTMCGHGIIAVATLVFERGLLNPRTPSELVLDSPAGRIHARVRFDGQRVAGVSFTNVPSFVLHAGVPVRVNGREMRADVAFGGAFYAIVDSEAVGLSVDASRVPELRRAGVEISAAVDAVQAWANPVTGLEEGIAGTIFTAPPRSEGADLRSVTVFRDGQVGRSPGGTGTAALIAVLDAMGLVADDRPFIHEGIVETRLSGRIAGRTSVGGLDAIVAEVEGSAWITGEHTFVAAPGDPFAEGLVLA